MPESTGSGGAGGASGADGSGGAEGAGGGGPGGAPGFDDGGDSGGLSVEPDPGGFGGASGMDDGGGGAEGTSGSEGSGGAGGGVRHSPTHAESPGGVAGAGGAPGFDPGLGGVEGAPGDPSMNVRTEADNSFIIAGAMIAIGVFAPEVALVIDVVFAIDAVIGVAEGRDGAWTDLALSGIGFVGPAVRVTKGSVRLRRAVRTGEELSEASRAGRGTHAVPSGPPPLVGTSTSAFRRDAARLINNTEGHPLKFLLDESGNFKQSRGLPHSELADRPDLVQMGHIESAKGGGQRVVLQGAWENQFNNVTVEHPGRGGSFVVNEAVEIGGVGVEAETAKMWERYGFIPSGTVENAPRIR